MTTLKIRKIGNSIGVVLPKDVLEMLDAKEGDVISFARGAEGVIVTVSDEETDRLRALGEEIMVRRSKVLRAVAK